MSGETILLGIASIPFIVSVVGTTLWVILIEINTNRNKKRKKAALDAKMEEMYAALDRELEIAHLERLFAEV